MVHRAAQSVPLALLRLAGQLCVEKIARPQAIAAGDVPVSVEAIQPRWLTAVLAGNNPGAEVRALRIERASSGTHARHRLHLDWNDEGRGRGLPATIFTKSLPTLVTRMVAGFNGHARIEGRFYTQLRPELAIEAPTCYHSCYDRRNFSGIHLLEDLVATKGATFCDHTTAVSQSMAEDMVDLLARLHGHFYASPRLAAELRWLADFPTWFTIGAEKMRTEHYTEKACLVAADLMPADLLARRTEIWPAVMRALDLHRALPATLIHSDVHIGNWYQTNAGHMGLCDWQCPSKGHWSRDFAYAVTAALEPHDRRLWERELLRRYLGRLQEICGARTSLDDAWTWYRQQIFQAFTMWTITLCHSPLLPSMQPEPMTLAMIARIATALSDLDCLDSFD